MKLSVVVPFFNELRTLPTVIDRLLAVDFAALGLETELIFVDDGSTDAGRGLLDPAPREDVRLIVHQRNVGKGGAVRTGLEAATGDVLCIQDADLEYHPADLPALLQPILSGDYEVVYGNRFRGSAAGLYFSHRVANRMLNLMVNLAFNRYLSDVYTGYKVFTRHAFEGLALSAKSFTVEMELTAHFLRKGLVIFEVPISYRARTYAEGKKIHFKDGVLATGALLRYRLRWGPAAELGPASRRAPDVPGETQAIEGDATIHALGLEDLSSARRYHRYVYDLLVPYLGSSVLEVEAGLGDFSGQLVDRERLVLSEMDPICLRALEDRYGAQERIEIVEAHPARIKVEPRVDTAIALNVIGRIEDDVAVLRSMARAVVPGGAVLLLVPGFPQLTGAFDEALGLRHRYTPQMLSQTVTAAGLVPEVTRAVNLLGGIAWWAAVRVARQGRPTQTLVSLYDKLVIPAERAIERRLQPSFGQSVLCVARVPTPPRA
ncbi:MAG TPA: glycosyltransferase family 2 protein [Actinomycetes bacterium]|jgi:SAM-dependent methyltransferase|nr:glycosyltransferase family 2 protein [Actinomycetes bacterium]